MKIITFRNFAPGTTATLAPCFAADRNTCIRVTTTVLTVVV